MNEICWSMGIAAISQRYSIRGLEAVAAINISETVANLFAMSSMALGISVSILVGQRLGAGKIEEAKDVDRKIHHGEFGIYADIIYCFTIFTKDI